MTFKITSLSLLALAALALSPPPAAQAATLLGPGTKVQTDNMIEQIQARMMDDAEDDDRASAKKSAPMKEGGMKAEKKGGKMKEGMMKEGGKMKKGGMMKEGKMKEGGMMKKGGMASKMKAGKPGGCGTFMFYNSKAKGCMDARNKVDKK